METKTVQATWFSNSLGCVGIVQVLDPYEGFKYYIASVPGLSEDLDMQRVADWGSTFPKDLGDRMFGVS